MSLTYEYFCEAHGVIELEHSIHDDRHRKRCPFSVRDRVKGGSIFDGKRRCDRLLKPLISSSQHHTSDGAPAVFRGSGWAQHELRSYREYHVDSDPKRDPFGDRAAKARRDPVAVR